MIDGVRRIVRDRGWDERSVMIGQGFDSRPLKPTLDFFGQIAPGVRWTVFSHWARDPGPVDGKLVVNEVMEVGYREEVAGGVDAGTNQSRLAGADRPRVRGGVRAGRSEKRGPLGHTAKIGTTKHGLDSVAYPTIPILLARDAANLPATERRPRCRPSRGSYKPSHEHHFAGPSRFNANHPLHAP